MKSIRELSFDTFIRYFSLISILGLSSCEVKKTKVFTQQEVATVWADMTLFITKNTPSNSPTYASRCLGYIGVTMYESVVKGYPNCKSLAGQLNGLNELPEPEKNAGYSWLISLNAGQALILKRIYNQTSDVNKQRVDSLEKVIFEQFSEEIKDKDIVTRSVAYGKTIAEAVFEWSKTDGGHRGYLHNFDKTLMHPQVPGSWEPPLYGQSFSHFPLHPHWGNNRTFVKINAELPTPDMIHYKNSVNCDYYNQFSAVYEKSKILTQRDKEAALWWADDPGETFTPPGHSYYLATLVLKKQNPDLIKCAETYARVGIAVADAFINCWKWKYQFFSERPSGFISKNIDSTWTSFWPDPPFPAFPSGHATQAGAVATVLIDLYGEKMAFIDDSHAGRAKDELRNVEFKPRSFTSFWQVAEETANSRFFGGIHTPQDNAVGLAEGKKMGNNVNLLNWGHEKTLLPKTTDSHLNRIALQVVSILYLLICNLPANAQAIFKDVTEKTGIKHQFVVYEGMFGGGACVLDFNNDGYEDLFLTGGMGQDALYLNNKNGTFTNIYEQSGLKISAKYVTQGAVSADVNRDGWVDLFITTITTKDSIKTIPRAENLLFLNNGNATFRDATKEYELNELMSFSTGASFGDFNADGYPDLYVGNYFLDYQGELNSINDATIVNANQTSKGYLLKNKGGKYFSNVYADYNLKHKGFGFGGVFTDYDNDQDADLFVNHDFGYKATPDLLLNNQYPKRFFMDLSKEQHMNLKINAMGTAVGDYNNDGLLDYYVTNIRFNQFMVNQGQRKGFVEKSKELGMGYVSISWGANFADFDNDTDLDLFVANGDLNPNDVPMADFYFENNNGKFTEKAAATGVNDYGVGRGSVVFDMDNDGDLDILVINQKPVLNYPVTSETRIYRNETVSKGNWLKIALKGVEAETHGLGSRVEVVIGKLRMIREIDGGSSHLSQNSVIAHFGLGAASSVDSVIVKWIGGKKQIFTNQKVNTLLTITESPEEFNGTYLIIGILVFLPIALFSIYWFIRKSKQQSVINLK